MTAQLAGKKRSFGRGLGLTIITLGIYSIYWNYVARNEIYDQEKRGDFPIVLFLLGFIPFLGLIFVVLYVLRTQGAIQEARVAKGLAPGVGGWEIVLWNLLPLAGVFISYYKAQTTFNEYWDAAATTSMTPTMPTPPPLPTPPVG